MFDPGGHFRCHWERGRSYLSSSFTKRNSLLWTFHFKVALQAICVNSCTLRLFIKKVVYYIHTLSCCFYFSLVCMALYHDINDPQGPWATTLIHAMWPIFRVFKSMVSGLQNPRESHIDQYSYILLWGIHRNINSKQIIEYFHLNIIPMTLHKYNVQFLKK